MSGRSKIGGYRLAAAISAAAGAGGLALLGAIRVTGVLDGSPDPRALLDEYCVECHNYAEFAGNVAFDTLELHDLPADAEIWERAVRKVRTGFMPPAGEPRPERAVLDRFAAELEARLDRAAAEAPNPGVEGLSRLNRVEYRNAVRDLLAYDASAMVASLPADDAIRGFDNIANALTVSPTLIQSYVNAAMKISREAVGDRSLVPGQVRYDAPAGLSQDRHLEGLPLGTRGGMLFTHNFPLDATYEFHVAGRGTGVLSGQRFCPPPKIDVALNGEPVDVDNPAEFRLRVAAGPQTVAVALVDEQRCAGVNELYGSYSAPGGIRNVEIHGPFDATGPGDTPSRRAIFTCYPERADKEGACARRILTNLATKAFRRPMQSDDAEIDTLMAFYGQGRREGDFETGIQQALSRLLIDPRFLYRFEAEPADLAAGEVYRISDLELASRLSFFLWSSIPDEELIETASAGGLSEPDVLEQQVLRMLADPRAHALVENFAGQWLKLRELRDALPQDPEFDANLREAFRGETELLFSSVIREDRTVLDLLDADYTYLNERLAEHYGIFGVRGSYMRRVELDADSPRRGLLGHGSILTVTSVANRTSPVVRGVWIVENMLGAEVPPPPPGVEADLSEESSVAEAKTLRERMERHRTDTACASCHQLIDPFGFALENFDLVGRWRDTEAGRPVDTVAELADGSVIDGPIEMRQALLDRDEQVVTAMTERLLTYALGRILEHYDMPAVRRIIRDAEGERYRFSSIVLGIVNSEPFQMKVKRAGGEEAESPPARAEAIG
ncbi:MAG: DUF1592 domain-containing protein [Gammaproteobacteria bacterium]|nr:DUF1592 domain-containing protein [Gammaproteobacteria bacterium]